MAQPTGLGNTNFYYVTAQGRYYLVPTPNVQPAAQPPQLPVLPSIDAPRVDAIGRLSLQPRPALAPAQNLPTLEPQALAASPHIPVGLEKFLIEKIAETRRLASMRTAQQVENTGLSKNFLVQPIGPYSHPSNLFYIHLPTSHVPAPMLRGELPPIPLQSQQGIVPAAAVQAAPQHQQGAQPPAREKSAGVKRQAPGEPANDFDFRGTTPESYQMAQKAKAEKKAKAQQGLPEPQPAAPKTPAPRKRIAHPVEKPAAADLDFKETLTPKNYLEERAKTRARYMDPYYATSKDALEAFEWISEAANYLCQKEYTEAVTAIYLAYEKLPYDGFYYKLFDNLVFDKEISANLDPRICSSNPEENLDVLVLRGIRKIKHGKYEEAEHSLRRVLDQKPNDQLARLLLDNARRLSDQYLQSELRKDLAESATNYDSVKLG